MKPHPVASTLQFGHTFVSSISHIITTAATTKLLHVDRSYADYTLELIYRLGSTQDRTM